MILQIQETAALLNAAESQGFLVYFLVFIIIVLGTLVMFLYKKVESKNDQIIEFYQNNSKTETHFKELTQMIRDRNIDALKELMATMEAERRLTRYDERRPKNEI